MPAQIGFDAGELARVAVELERPVLVLGQIPQTAVDDVRATMLEEQLDRYLARCGEFVSDIEHTLKVRHDMGNHVQVVLALSERGNFQEAHEHLACMAEVLNDTRRSEEAVL